MDQVQGCIYLKLRGACCLACRTMHDYSKSISGGAVGGKAAA